MVSRERERERERAASATPLFPQEERGKEKEGKKEGKKGKEAGRKEAGAREGGEGTTKPKVSLARVARTRARARTMGERRKHCGLTWGQSR